MSSLPPKLFITAAYRRVSRANTPRETRIGLHFAIVPSKLIRHQREEKRVRFPTLFGVLLLASGLIFPAQAGTLVQVNAAGALPDTALDLTTANPGEIIGSIPSTTDPLLGVNIFKIHINA